jgi:hypothetical protein
MAGVSARAPARERLLDAAEELFYECGIAATGVDAVLRRAHVAPATLYAHFARQGPPCRRLSAPAPRAVARDVGRGVAALR